MNISPLFRIGCTPPVRLWGGFGWLDLPADPVEPSGARYIGGGQLVSIPDLDQVLNGTASRIEITVSGVSAVTLALAIEDAPTVKGATCDIGLVHFDADWRIAEVEWLGELRADSLTTASDQGDNGRNRSITLSLGTEDTDRSRAPVAFWTDADQRRRSPTDRFCDHVAGISAGTSRRFGPSA